MLSTKARAYRILVEEKLVEREFPQFGLQWDGECRAHFEGWQSTSSGKQAYQLRLELEGAFPDVCPALFVWSPITLRTYDGGTVNAQGLSHGFHTLSNGPGGRVRVCLAGWDACSTCVQVLLTGILWLEAYAGHLATGKPIDAFLGWSGGPTDARPGHSAAQPLPSGLGW